MDIFLFVLIFLIAFVIVVLLTPWVARIARHFDVMQHPPATVMQKLPDTKSKTTNPALLEAKLIAARRRLDKPPVPLWGGIAYILPFLVISIVVLMVSKSINITPDEVNSYILWFFAICVLFALGILDDKYELSGRVQIIFHMIAALLFVLSPINLDILTNPITGLPFVLRSADYVYHIGLLTLSFSFPGDLFLFIWILVLINAIKWQGGSDALMESNVFVSALIIFVVSFIFAQSASALFSIVLAGCVLGFILYNFHPAKIESGSSGKSVIGFILATLAIISQAKFAVSFIIFAVPLIDMAFVLIRRIFEYKPKSPFELLLLSDKSHFHHKLRRLGLSEPRIVIVEASLTLAFGLLAIFLTGLPKLIFVIVTWICVFFVILYVTTKTNAKR